MYVVECGENYMKIYMGVLTEIISPCPLSFFLFHLSIFRLLPSFFLRSFFLRSFFLRSLDRLPIMSVDSLRGVVSAERERQQAGWAVQDAGGADGDGRA